MDGFDFIREVLKRTKPFLKSEILSGQHLPKNRPLPAAQKPLPLESVNTILGEKEGRREGRGDQAST